MQEEVWKDIAGYEGKYQVSNWGRLKRLPFVDGSNHYLPERIKETQILPNGYVRSALFKDGNMRNVLIHRLVAEAFRSAFDATMEIYTDRCQQATAMKFVEYMHKYADGTFLTRWYWLRKARKCNETLKGFIQLNEEYSKH